MVKMNHQEKLEFLIKIKKQEYITNIQKQELSDNGVFIPGESLSGVMNYKCPKFIDKINEKLNYEITHRDYSWPVNESVLQKLIIKFSDWEICDKDTHHEGLFIRCRNIGLSEDGISIPLHQIPIIKNAINEYEKSMENKE